MTNLKEQPGYQNILNNIVYRYSKYVVLAILMYMPVFGFIDFLPLRIWDESRIATNAYEMFKNGDYIVTYYDHMPDMWNTKPPLLVWCQVLLMKLIGVNELATRLPSGLAAFFTSMALMVFCKRYLKSSWLGIITVMVLITSNGYIHYHMTRTGDYDALLTLFTTISCLFFYSFSETKNNRYLYLFFISLALAVLTKGIAGLMFGPALLIYVLYRKQLRLLLLNRHFYAGLFIFLLLAVGYYLLRELKNPGYIAQVADNELGGRYLKSQGNQTYDFWFYFNNFVNKRLADRYLLIPCGFILGMLSRDHRIRKFTMFVFLLFITFFLIISAGKTRMEWYDAPLFPFLAYSIALAVYYFFELLRNLKWATLTLRANALPVLLLFLVFAGPYHMIVKKTYYPEEEYHWDYPFYEIGYFLQDAVKGKFDMEGKYLVYDGYYAQNTFYLYSLNEQGVKTSLKRMEHVKPGDEIIVSQENVRQYITEKFKYTEKHLRGQIYSYKIFES